MNGITRLVLVMSAALLINTYAMADALSKADAAVSDVLFAYDGSEEYASYRVREDGSVDMIFARNTPDNLYEEILTRLQNHPDIRSVLAGKGGPSCRLF